MTASRPQPRSAEAAALLLIRLAVLAILMSGLARSWADPDLWGHVRFGGDILRHGLAATDPYSFTSDIPWVNHEWFAEAVLYGAWFAGGGPGLVLFKLAVILGTLWLAVATLRGTVPSMPRDLAICVLLFGLWPRVYVIRPQLFSIVLFAALLWIVRAIERGSSRTLWLLPAVFLVWVNAHGGWIVGIGALLLWSAAALAGVSRDVPRRTALLASAISLVATLANPYGVGLWTFLFATVGLNRPNINDWRPLVEAGSQVIVPWCLTAALAVVALARGGRRIPVAHALITVGLGLASVRVNRLDVFFTLSAVMLLTPYVTAPAPLEAAPKWTGATRAAAVALAVALAFAGWRQRESLTCVRLDGPWMPEREAGAFIAANALHGRLLAWFDWGQYAIWHFGPGLKVSMDGRRETVYSDALVARHLRLYYEPAAAGPMLDELRPDYAWLPAGIPLSAELDRAGWHRLYSGPISIVFSRDDRQTVAEPVLRGSACFPGP